MNLNEIITNNLTIETNLNTTTPTNILKNNQNEIIQQHTVSSSSSSPSSSLSIIPSTINTITNPFQVNNNNNNNENNISNQKKNHPTIGDITIKYRYWGCLICKSLKNNVKVKICKFCQTKRSQDRFIIQRNNALYLCKVHTEKVFPIVSIFKTFLGKEISGKVRLRMIGDTLRESMEAAINDFESENFLTIRTTRGEGTGTSNNNTARSNNNSNNNHNNYFRMNSETNETNKEQLQEEGRLKEDLSLDLFHRVM